MIHPDRHVMQEPTPSRGPSHSSRDGVWATCRRGAPFLALALLAAPWGSEARAERPGAERQQALVRVVRQDCGSCHGMRLTGGLGPALTREALADKPLEALSATIFHGRPGTPMPGWRAMLSEDEARWIAEQLAAGFPDEPRKARP